MSQKDKKTKRPYTPSIKIGRYRISRFTDISVLIEDLSDGDAGAFATIKLEKVLHDFFEKEF